MSGNPIDNDTASSSADPARRKMLRTILCSSETYIMPGGFSPLYARMAELAGFSTFFVAGSQVASFLYGVPDVGVIGLRDMVDHARHVAARTSLPVMADADTGYGNAINVHFAVGEFIRAGLAAIQIEDQEAPKKSGTGAGRRCISHAEAVSKIRAAVAARDAIDRDFVVCARTDAIGAEDETFETAVDRLTRYTEAGADLVWLNNVQTLDQVEVACSTLNSPVLILWGGGGNHPTKAEFAERGARIVLIPVIAAQAGMEAAWQALNALQQQGLSFLDDWNAGCHATPWGRAPWGDLTGLNETRSIEEAFLPEESRRNYAKTFGHKDNFYG